MKKISVLIVLLGFFFFGIGNAQIDTQEVAGWKIIKMRGNVQTATSTIIDTISQSFHVELQNYDDSAYVMWGKKLDRTYSIPAYDTAHPYAVFTIILWNVRYKTAGPNMAAIFFQFYIGIGGVAKMHPLQPGFLDARAGSEWLSSGSATNYYPNPPQTMDSVGLKIFTNGTYGELECRGVTVYYEHNDSSSGVTKLDSAIVINIFGDKATAIDVSRETIPQTFQLSQNYPNPFNPGTSIRYQVVGTTHVRLAIYDVLGREVATLVNEEKPAGTYEAIFNASNLSSGTYFYRLTATSPTGGFVLTKKMILLR